MGSHWFLRAYACFGSGTSGVTSMDYRGFTIELFEAGTGLWHARIQLADQKPIIIDGVLFSALEVGFAWSTPEAAAADARSHIDLLNQRCANFGQKPQAERPAAV